MKQTRNPGISEFILKPLTIKDLPQAFQEVMYGGRDAIKGRAQSRHPSHFIRRHDHRARGRDVIYGRYF